MSTVDVVCYVIVGVKLRGEGKNAWVRGRPTVRVSKTKPSVAGNEVPVRIELRLPIALFQKPDLEAIITIPEEKTQFIITPEVQQNIADAIRAQTGMEISLRVEKEPE